MKLKVHPALCAGHRECHRFAPDFFILDEEGHLELRAVEVPPELEHASEMAAASCPTHAITIIRERSVV